nr:retrotransposon protein, putative, unclassified [Tanacetum cinerariifolium]
MASEHSSLELALHEITPAAISSGLVPNPPLLTLFIPPSRTDWGLLFQPLFDELLNPPPSVDHPASEVIAQIAEVVALKLTESTSSPSSTTVNTDAPSANVIPTVVHTTAPNSEHVNKWTKHHPSDNIIYELGRPVSIRLQLHKQALFCYYDAFLSIIKPNTYKDAFTQACWIEAMLEELNEFERLQISQSPRGIFLNQSKYVLESLKKYGMESIDPVDTLMVGKSKLDEDPQGKAIDPTHYHGMEKPTKKKLHAVKRIFKYLRGTIKWDSVLWMRSQLTYYGIGFNKTPMYYDNKSAIALFYNNVQHSRSKHIDIRFHFIIEQVENGLVEIYFVNTGYHLADIFTKSPCRERIELLINKLGMQSFMPETLQQLADEDKE